MFCKNCGTHISDDSKFCYKCGTPTHIAEQKDQIAANDYDPFDFPPTASYNPAPTPQPRPQPQAQHQPQQQTSAADEGIYGLLGFVFAFLIPILGLIFSIIGMSKKKNNGLATAGFVLSLVVIIIAVIAIIVGVTAGTSSYYYY
ncbi:MAG: zinc ribbon domain-containing protein [Clostridiales bacterium]|nr:zinc ribbon domain-containing protein [Clostridiales bacterium]